MPNSKHFNGKEYYSIGAASKDLHISPATLRRWCNPDFQKRKGLNLEVIVDPINGYRYISAESIEKLKGRFLNS